MSSVLHEIFPPSISHLFHMIQWKGLTTKIEFLDYIEVFDLCSQIFEVYNSGGGEA